MIKNRIGETNMAEIKILKTDSRGRVILPPPFRKEPLLEYDVRGDQIILYPVRTVRKYPDMSDLPEEELSLDWIEREKKVNTDTRPGIVDFNPFQGTQEKEEITSDAIETFSFRTLFRNHLLGKLFPLKTEWAKSY